MPLSQCGGCALARLRVETTGSVLRWCFSHLEETTMKTGTIALATVVALSGLLALSPAQAKHYYHHHHHKHHMMMDANGPSGPSLDGGGTDKSRVGARGVSRKAPD
jgi:hypothetical protein